MSGITNNHRPNLRTSALLAWAPLAILGALILATNTHAINSATLLGAALMIAGTYKATSNLTEE